MDNQFGQGNTYMSRTATPQNNYDLAAEYSISNFDSPHRIVLAPIVQLPGPKNTRGAAYLLLGGWNASAVVELASGPPLNAGMNGSASSAHLGLFSVPQRPDPTGDP